MEALRKDLHFWGRNWLECMGMAAGAALVMIAFFGIGSREIGSRGIGKMLCEEMAMYPYYLIAMGAFIICMVTISYFQLYFSILLSMGLTRKAIVRGILLCTASVMLGILLLAGVIWQCLPDNISASESRLLPLLAGGLFTAGAVSVVLGVVVKRWGNIGTIIFFIICMVAGGFVGFCFASGDGGMLLQMLRGLTVDFLPAPVIGGVVYILAAAFAVAMTRKLES